MHFAALPYNAKFQAIADRQTLSIEILMLFWISTLIYELHKFLKS